MSVPLPSVPRLKGARNNRHATTACDHCRRRKTKCDGKKPSCRACVRRGEECQWTPDSDRRTAVGRKCASCPELRATIAGLQAEVARLKGLLSQYTASVDTPHTLPYEQENARETVNVGPCLPVAGADAFPVQQLMALPLEPLTILGGLQAAQETTCAYPSCQQSISFPLAPLAIGEGLQTAPETTSVEPFPPVAGADAEEQFFLREPCKLFLFAPNDAPLPEFEPPVAPDQGIIQPPWPQEGATPPFLFTGAMQLHPDFDSCACVAVPPSHFTDSLEPQWAARGAALP